MEEGEGIAKGFASEPATSSKCLVEKRNSHGLEEKDEFGCKRVKVRDLDSAVAVSDEATTQKPQSVGNIEIIQQSNLCSEEMSGVTEMPVTPYAEGSEGVGRENDALPPDSRPPVTRKVPETGTYIANVNSNSADDNRCIGCCGKQPLVEEHIREDNNNQASRREIRLDINAEDLSSSGNHDFSCFLKNSSLLKLRQVSESGSTGGALVESDSLLGWKETRQNGLLSSPLSGNGPDGSGGPLGESDSMRRWMEMKRNGFLSGPLGGVAASNSSASCSHGEMPGQKQQKSKRKADFLKKKREFPKREQLDRFSNIAAPSGLLKELNPGIINHVRNKKQVRAIIEALVRNGAEDVVPGKKHVGMNEMGIDYSHFSCEDVSLADCNQTRKHSVSAGNSSTIISEDKITPRMADSVGEDRTIPFKLSSNDVSENASSITNVESANCSSAASLTIEAATVASQWLELLHRDISGRLSALQRSRKRVQGIVTTDLPLLVLKEFPSNQADNPHVRIMCGDGFSDKTTVEWHQTRWTLLFDQINKALSDEERDLECWLHQVQEMQLQCSQGLQHMELASPFSSQSSGLSETDSRSGNEGSTETNLAVQAAAASIYSTCSLLLSTGNSTSF